MPQSGNFNPEWGYLAPAPGFLRTVRVVLVATTVGVVAGAGVVFSLVGHPAEEIAVAARTMFRPVEAVSARANASPLATNTHFPTQHRSQPSLAVNGQSASTPSSESSATSTTQVPEGASALAEAAAGTDAPAKAAIAAPRAAAKPPVVIAAPIKKRAMKKPNMTWRYASRDEPLGLVPGEYDTRRIYHAGGARGGYYRDGGPW
jgi:hypothetical protein